MSDSQTTRVETLRQVEVELVPKQLLPGILYHSEKYDTCIHLCACGCGNKTVTPLHGDGWKLTEGPTLTPSIGNMKVCGAHYQVIGEKIQWC